MQLAFRPAFMIDASALEAHLRHNINRRHMQSNSIYTLPHLDLHFTASLLSTSH
jgi:hypothetical protein